MTGPSHAVAGIAAVVTVSRLSGINPTAVELLAAILGALAPDLDTDGSTISRPGSLFKFLLGWKLAKLLDTLFSGISGAINFLFGHRGFIHAPLLAVGFIVLGAGFNEGWLAWFGCGYLSHLVGDMMTPAGIPLLSPIRSKRISVAAIRTGSAAELLTTLALLLFVVIGGWGLLPEPVKDTHRAAYQLVVEQI